MNQVIYNSPGSLPGLLCCFLSWF